MNTSTMRLKSYFAGKVETAMDLARQELGPDAMLVRSRKAPPEARHLGEYEIVFGTVPESAGQGAGQANAALGSGSFAAGAQGSLTLEIASLRSQLSALRRDLARTALTDAAWLSAGSQLGELYATLLSADVEPQLAQRLLKGVQARLAGEPQLAPAGDLPFGAPPNAGPLLCRRPLPRFDTATLKAAVSAEIESAFSTDATAGHDGDRPAIVALVGPPGCGKTTTIAKLAVNLGLRARRRTQLLSLDNYRIAAPEQLRSYAAIIGVGCETLDTTRALAQALEEYRTKSLVLIDTLGYGFGDLPDAAEVAQFLSSRSDIQTHLVIPASMKSADMNRLVDSFEMFGVSRLLFTKLDETGTFGPILSLSARTGIPLSFFASGQRVPEDLQPATKARLTTLVLSERAMDSELSVA